MATNLSYVKSAGRHLGTLLEIGGALSAALSASAAFQRVLEVLERHHEFARHRYRARPRHRRNPRRSLCRSGDAGRGAHYRLGEGITGKVVETGKPIVVPQVSREPMFLNRVGQRKDLDKRDSRLSAFPSSSTTGRSALSGSTFNSTPNATMTRT